MSDRRRIIVPAKGQPWIVTLGSDMADEGLRSCFHDVLMDRGQAEEWVRRKYRNAEQVASLIDEAWPVVTWDEVAQSVALAANDLMSFRERRAIERAVFAHSTFDEAHLDEFTDEPEQPTEPELLVLECELVAISQTKEPSGDLCLIVRSGLTFDQAIGLTIGHQFRVVLQEVKG